MSGVIRSDIESSIFQISTDTWSSRPLRLFAAKHHRRFGLRPLPGPYGVLLRTRSIHTFGMAVPIAVVALSHNGVVLRSEVVPPRRVFIVPSARWIVEAAFGPLPLRGEFATVER